MKVHYGVSRRRLLVSSGAETGGKVSRSLLVVVVVR